MIINLYDVWWASVRFEDKSGSKVRPVIICRINGDDGTYTVIPVTTHAPRNEPGEYPIAYYDRIILPSPSVARCGHIFDICENDLCRKIGELHPFDVIGIKSIMEKISRLYR